MNTDALEKAINIAGSQTALANMIGRRQSTIWTWMNRDKKVSPEGAAAIERATNGQVTRHELRPDIFGPAPADNSNEAA